MELKEGMYVRTKDGFIDKVTIDYKGYCNSPTCNCKHVSCEHNYYDEDEIIKVSHRIIDLIEVGDYVNGYMVLDVTEQYIKLNNPKLNYDIIDYERIFKNKYSNIAIRDVVTKEQFENMMYIVESE